MNDFPIFFRKIHGKRLVYLDNAATTQKPRHVIDAIVRYYETSNANIHRGIYTLSEEATQQYEDARVTIAKFVHVPARNIIFTSGTTHGINMVAHSLQLGKGDEILLTPVEHHANIVPWQQAAVKTGAKVVFCNLNDDFTIDLEDLKKKMSKNTKILALTHISNVTGAITPLEQIIPHAKELGIPVLVDGAQAVPHMSVNISEIGCDFYVFSGHKMLGPTGIGALYIADDHYNMEPFITGGDMIEDVTESASFFAKDEPRRFEAGTPNIAGAIGFAAAASYLHGKMVEIEKLEHQLTITVWDALEKIPQVTLYGPTPDNNHAGIISFNITGVHPHDVAQILDAEGICIRSGKHCAHPLLSRMNIPATNRVSFYLYNTQDDVDALIAGVKKIIKVFS